MPLSVAHATATNSWILRPQDLICVLNGTRCLPRKCSKEVLREQAVRKLAVDIEQLDAQESFEIRPNSPKGQTLHTLSEDVQKQLHFIMDVIKELTDQKDKPPCPKQIQVEDMNILDDFISADIPAQLLAKLNLLDFEARKDVMNVCCALLWMDLPDKVDRQVLEYIKPHPRFFPLLLEGYNNEEAALHCGVVLRSCLRHDELVQSFLKSNMVLQLIRYAKHSSMDISQDAFCSLREVLLVHKAVSAPWVNSHCQQFVGEYSSLLESKDYLVVRSALALLAPVLLSSDFRILDVYIEDDRNLRSAMNMLRDSSRAVQMDAFEVFKSFVLHPMTPKVQQILYKNKEKLIAVVESLQPTRMDDTAFQRDQEKVIETLRPLSPTKWLKRCPTSKETICSVGSSDSELHDDGIGLSPPDLGVHPSKTGKLRMETTL